ncbi:MAG TPA: proline--tRNA ligase [Dehalococcoidia bacterium]|nr:proline--tRNA ligase [Dehalococcoidia bacterium]
MRYSQLFGKTLRQAPAEAESDNHRLLLRAGLIMQLVAGVYSYLPMGWRVVRRIEQIVREEMNLAGGQELHMPVIHPADLWDESGRREAFGETLFSLKDRRERQLVLGPTHEEVVVDLVRRTVQSYRDLPLMLYQIQTKLRDEARPRGGLLRVREFIMKDLYSFDADWDALDDSYDSMYAAYTNLFRRCGVPTVPVYADSGAIGGKDSQEFLFLTPIGEDTALICSECGYAANAEKAIFRKPAAIHEDPLPLETVSTPGIKTIDALAGFLSVPVAKTLKAVIYRTESGPVFVAIRGDMEVNETKLTNALKARHLTLMDDDDVRRAGLVAGSASPVGLTGIPVVADDAVPGSPNLIAGANQPDTHLRNVNYGRDWTATTVTDIALAQAGDCCGECSGELQEHRGIEMGHIFKLGTLYSEKMGAEFLDALGASRPCIMGCYGVGVDRILAAAIEANHDDDGIIWPREIAPFNVHLVALNLDRPGVREAAESVYAGLRANGVETLLDDREEAAGVKFKDADLLGMPLRLTVSPRTLERNAAEAKLRRSREQSDLPLNDVVAGIRALLG